MSYERWGKTPFTIKILDGIFQTIHVRGRDRWALECLIEAGAKGCSPIDHPGPRWSAYVHDLRKMGVDIETITEPHGEPFAGTHARYVLQCQVRRGEGVCA